jgi:thymidine kinase
MPKLYFRYGTMNSSKTANLLMVAHNYKTQGKKALIFKPEIDDRFGKNVIKSRTGLSDEVDVIISEDTKLDNILLEDNVVCILVDEANFLLPKHVDQLRNFTKYVPVICYGLRTDYKSNFFPGSQRLMEIADTIEEIKTICVTCHKKSIINAKFSLVEGKKYIIKTGSDKPDLGAEEKYQSMCWECWNIH